MCSRGMLITVCVKRVVVVLDGHAEAHRRELQKEDSGSDRRSSTEPERRPGQLGLGFPLVPATHVTALVPRVHAVRVRGHAAERSG